MMFCECPYDDCDEFFINGICENPPMFQKLTCERCGRIIWLYHSRIDPAAYTETDFREKYLIDETNKRITKRKEHHE